MINHTITIKGLQKVRESGESRFTLDVPAFQVAEGEFIAIVGASGCGKSTLMDMIALVLRPSSVEVFDVSGASGHSCSVKQLWSENQYDELSSIRRNSLGYVLQSGGLFPYLTVRDNVHVARQLKQLSHDETLMHETALAIGLGVRKSTFDKNDALKNADFSLLNKKPRYLSGGQRQRAAILRALMSEPDIILADEPTAAVDEITGRSIIDQFKGAAKRNSVSVVMVTHDRSLARGHVDRAYTFELSCHDVTGHISSTLVPLSADEL